MEQINIPNLIVEVTDDDLFCSEELADEALHNTVNALMQTLDIRGLAKISEAMSCDEDFNPNNPQMSHNKKYNHTRSAIKVGSLLRCRYG